MATTSTTNAINNRSNSEIFGQQPEVPITQVVVEFFVLLLKFLWFILEAFVKLFIPVTEKSIKGEVTLITGAAHGIGRELAFQYASRGATVVCLDINKDGNEETVKEIAQLGYTKAYSYVCDVTNRKEVFEVAEQIQKEIGVVSILINNAGILHSEKLLDSTEEMIERTLNVNTISHFWTIQAFLPKMLELNHGHIVALSSCAGLLGLKYLVPYCASKFAVRGLMEALRYELKVYQNCKVKLTAIYPHIVDTGLCKKPFIRHPSLTPMVKPLDAAKHIISAQCRNVEETSIPSNLFTINLLMRLFPAAVSEAVMDFLDVCVMPDS